MLLSHSIQVSPIWCKSDVPHIKTWSSRFSLFVFLLTGRSMCRISNRGLGVILRDSSAGWMFARTRAWTWLLQLKDSCPPAHSVSLLTTVTLAAAVPAWDGKRLSDPSAKDNRKYDMGMFQLSGSPTMNITSQNRLKAPSSKLWAFTSLRETPLILIFLPVTRVTAAWDAHPS